MIKQFLSSVIAKCRDLSVSCGSIICRSLRYFAQSRRSKYYRFVVCKPLSQRTCLYPPLSPLFKNITTPNRKYILMVVFKSNGLPSSEQAPIKLTTLGWFPIEAIVLSSLYKSRNSFSVPCSRNRKYIKVISNLQE